MTLSESDFMEQVRELAHLCGWRTLHIRRSVGRGQRWTTTTSIVGWPDLLCWSERQRRVLAAELKSERGTATPEQLDVLRSLEAAGIEVFLWRPSNWSQIEAVLGARRAA